MKLKIGKCLLFAILTTLFLSIILVFPAHASVPPTNPYLEVRDDGSVDGVADNKVVFDKFTPAVGVFFEVDVYLMDLDAGWALYNASFALNYDPALIAVVGVIWDPAWFGPNVVGIVPGSIWVFVQNHPAPAGEVLIATITFKVLNQEASPPFPSGYYDYSLLDFQDIEFWRIDSIIPHDPPVDGEVFVYALEGAAVPGFPTIDVSVIIALLMPFVLLIRFATSKRFKVPKSRN